MVSMGSCHRSRPAVDVEWILDEMARSYGVHSGLSLGIGMSREK